MWKSSTFLVGLVALVTTLVGQSRKATDLTLPESGGRLGIDLSGFDRSVRPQDDFFLYANGAWLKNAVIPEDKSNFGVAGIVSDKAEADVRKIIEEVASGADPAGSIAQKVGDLYSSYMNEALAEKLGITPLSGELTSIDLIDSKPTLLKRFAQMRI